MSYFLINGKAVKYVENELPKIDESKLDTSLYEWLITYAIYNNLNSPNMARYFFKLSFKNKEFQAIYKKYKLPDYTNYFLQNDPFFPLEDIEIKDKEVVLSACLKQGYCDKALYIYDGDVELNKVKLPINKLKSLEPFYIMLLKKKNALNENQIERLILESIRQNAVNLFSYMASKDLVKRNINLTNLIDQEGSIEIAEIYSKVKKTGTVTFIYDRAKFSKRIYRVKHYLKRMIGAVPATGTLRFVFL